jgi:adenylosuccinate synthase
MVKVAARLGLYGREHMRLVDVVVGGQYGSEGKGHIASYLAREYQVLVRVGGPNAGHTVYAEPRPYKFHHLPSGARHAPNAQLVMGPGANVWVPGIMREIAENQVNMDRLFIDPQAMVISDQDRRSEACLVESMGSTGQGVGAATARRVLDRQPGKVKLARDIPELKPFTRVPTREVLEQAYWAGKKVLLEGTQGTELSLFHGQYPYVTSRDTTVSGCLAEAGISASRTRKIVMVCRTYPIRVESPAGGTSGRMNQEICWKVVAKRSKLPLEEIQRTEKTTTTNRQRRVGEFEWDSLRKASLLNAPTDIALTFVDYIAKANRKARRFEQLTDDTIRFTEEVECVAGAPVSLISTRFDYRSIIDRRAW